MTFDDKAKPLFLGALMNKLRLLPAESIRGRTCVAGVSEDPYRGLGALAYAFTLDDHMEVWSLRTWYRYNHLVYPDPVGMMEKDRESFSIKNVVHSIEDGQSACNRLKQFRLKPEHAYTGFQDLGPLVCRIEGLLASGSFGIVEDPRLLQALHECPGKTDASGLRRPCLENGGTYAKIIMAGLFASQLLFKLARGDLPSSTGEG